MKHLQTEFILLRPDFCGYEGFFAELFPKGKDNEIELINREFVLSLISLMDTKWVKKVLTVFLGLDRSRREVDAIGIDSDWTVWDRNMVFGYTISVANVEKKAEQFYLKHWIERLKELKMQLKNTKQNF